MKESGVMQEKIVKQDLIEVRTLMSLPCRFDTGPIMGRFLRGLRDEGKILATYCSGCGRTFLPPVQVCSACKDEVSEWVELSDEGYLASFDVVVIPTINPLTGEMRKVPYSVGRMVLDGGDAMMWHFLDKTDPKDLAFGKRVKAVWAEHREGRITDIVHFKVLDQIDPKARRVNE